MSAGKKPTAKKTVGKNNKREDTWPGAIKAIGLKAVERGQLVSFGLLGIGAILAWRLDSNGVIEFAKLVTNQPLFWALGWILFFVCAFGMTWLLKAQRELHMREIERICLERNHWQQNVCQKIESSELEPTS